MAIEVNPNYPSDLDATIPTNSDLKAEGDDNFRNLKRVWKTTFPNVSGAITATHTEHNYLVGVTSAIQTQLDAKAPKASPTFTGTVTLPATGTGATEAVRKDYADALAFAAALPAQAGNAGKFVTTNGLTASWSGVPGTGGALAASGSVVLTSASASSQKLTFTAHGQSVTLPDATTLTKGVPVFALHNTSEFVGRVLDNAGTLRAVLAPGDVVSCSLADNSTAAGSWSINGGRIAGPTAQLSVTGTGLGGSGNTFQAIPLDTNRTFLLYGRNGLYGVVYDKSSQTWGSPTLIRASVVAVSRGILTAANQVMVVSAITTAMETTVLTITGTGIAINTPTAITLAGAIDTSTAGGFGDLIAVGSSWVVSYLRATTISGIAAITLSGTTPTVGSESAFAGTGLPAQLYASGAIVLAFGCIASGAGKVTPYTVSGSTLSAGTGASFGATLTAIRTLIFGTRWLAYYNDGGTWSGSLASLAGTVATASTVSTGLGTAAMDAVVCNAKVIVSGGSTGAGATQVLFNVLTDTAGTLSAGTAVTLSGATQTLPVPIGVSGTTATFACSSQFFQVSAAAASPVVALMPSVALDNTAHAAQQSIAKNGSGPSNAVYSGNLVIPVPVGGPTSVAYGLANSRPVYWGAGTNGYQGIGTSAGGDLLRARGNTTAELWSIQADVSASAPRYDIQLVEAAQ